MRSHSELYVHLVWATWDRTPWLRSGARAEVHGAIRSQAREMGVETLAVGGVEDHVHVVVRYPARVSISEIAKHLKGGSSRYVTSVMRLADPFRWQGTYGAFSLSRRGLDGVCAYVANQERHHRDGTLFRVLERTSTE
jgi:putative transposase